MEEQDQIIVLQKFDSSIQANIIKTKLDAHDIPCFLTGENMANLYPQQLFRAFDIGLYIFEKDQERAQQILADYQLTTNEEETRSCPQCKSTRIEFTQSKGALDTLIAILGVLVAMLVIPPKKVYHCEDCGHEF